jgi:hypothetical protein
MLSHKSHLSKKRKKIAVDSQFREECYFGTDFVNVESLK